MMASTVGRLWRPTMTAVKMLFKMLLKSNITIAIQQNLLSFSQIYHYTVVKLSTTIAPDIIGLGPLA